MDLVFNSVKLAVTKVTDTTVPQDDWGLVYVTVLTGLVVVFVILGLLVAILYGMGAILGGKKVKNAEPAEAIAPPVPVEPEISEELYEDNGEIVAVISAAIAAYSEKDGVNYTIKRIKRADKQPRSNWGNAGVNENTRPF